MDNMKILDFKTIRDLNISAKTVYDWCNEVWMMKENSILPAKVKMWHGDSGRYITMPCVMPSINIAGVKFISRNVDDRDGVPARNSNIIIQQCDKLGLLAVCDGIWITNMRTGAIAAHSFLTYKSRHARTLGLMGLGIAAEAFFYFIGNLYKEKMTVKLLRYKNQAEEFIRRNKKYCQFDFEIVDSYEDVCSCDVVVSAVGYARQCFAEESVFVPGCLVIPIQTSGFQNCDLVFDRIVIDDYEHVKSYKYYESFKARSIEVEKIVRGETLGRCNEIERVIAYCGGIALHDVYLAYKIYCISKEKQVGIDVPVNFPAERFWI